MAQFRRLACVIVFYLLVIAVQIVVNKGSTTPDNNGQVQQTKPPNEDDLKDIATSREEPEQTTNEKSSNQLDEASGRDLSPHATVDNQSEDEPQSLSGSVDGSESALPKPTVEIGGGEHQPETVSNDDLPQQKHEDIKQEPPSSSDKTQTLKEPPQPAAPKELPPPIPIEPGEASQKPAVIEKKPKSRCFTKGTLYSEILPDGQERCICLDGYYGILCQLRDTCKTIVADQMTGIEICERIGQTCLRSDKIFRCSCAENEYFVFKADHYRVSPAQENQEAGNFGTVNRNVDDEIKQGTQPNLARPSNSPFTHDAMLELVKQEGLAASTLADSKSMDSSGQQQTKQTYYLAECRPVDKCLGVRCRQLSEVCLEGECKCNQNLGYIRDPNDKLCKLLNPCNMPSTDDAGQTMPVCGEARCVPTYDKELFRCVCPIGYYAIQRGPERSSTKCAILSDFICIIPFLNKCQHKCEIDNNLSSYKCSCWPGYRPGSRPGIDDHLCFFEEHLGGMMVHSPYGQPELDDDEFSGSNKRTGRSADNVYGSDQQQQQQQQEQQPLFRRKIVFKQIVDNTTPSGRSADQGTGEKPGKLIQRIVVREQVARRRPIVMNERQHSQFDESQQEQQQQQQVNSLTEENQDDRQLDRELDTSSRHNNNIGDHQYGGDYEEEDSLASMSAQERCNMFCDENKICVLENEAAGSYKCVCDRQGYVSVGDKCMDWCAAVEFNHHLQFLLELTCLTGVCTRQPGNYRRPPSNMASSFYNSFEFRSLPPEERSQLRLEAKSSWRPKFQCDCKNSPLVYEDPISHQCKLNFTAILEPCLPGNPGHTECVINNHAYCSVLHKDPILHKRSHEMEHIITADKNKTIKIESKPVPGSVPPPKSSKKITPPEEEKRYACVCSPEKKLLVDGPRKKARCIKECDLLSNECGRFNRMCRSSTVASNDHFGYDPALVIEDRDGAIRMNQFKRTGCECLPGFSVSPSEARDFTLDTINYSDGDDPSTPSAPPSPTTASSSSSPFANGGGGPVEPNSCCSQKAHRTGWAAIETLQPGSSITLKSPAKLDQNVVPGEIPGVVIQAIEHLKKRYMNINSRCLLDYDVIEFRARFKVPASFEPSWMILNQRANQHPTSQQPPPPASNTSGGLGAEYDDSSSQSPPDGRQATGADQQAAQADDIMPYSVFDDEYNSRILMMPDFMRVNISEFHKHIVLVANCDFLISQKSFQAYEQCIRYRYWIVQKFRAHFADWRQVVTKDLNETFNLMDGNIRFRVNECKPIINRVTSVRRPMSTAAAGASSLAAKTREEILVALGDYDPWDQYARVDADLDCHLTIHSASDYDVSGARRDSQQKVRLEKQMPKFLFYEIVGANTNLQSEQSKKASQTISSSSSNNNINDTTTATPIAITKNIYNAEYFLMAPTTLIHKSTDEHSAANRKDFNPCNNENKYQYCDNQTRCEMVDTVSYSCKCETGYTPIGSRDIRFKDSLKEVCEDIDECLFDVCNADPRYAGKSECFNEIGSFRCRCIGKHIGDNRGYCVPICDLLACKYGVCHIITNNFAYCDCFEGYRDYNCSVQDPSAALRKANTIICCSIFASVLLLTITLAISFRSKLKKTKKELKRLQAAYEAVEFYEFSLQKPPYRHRVSKASIAS